MAMNVKVTGGDEVVDFGQGMFTEWKSFYCLSLSANFSILARAASVL